MRLTAVVDASVLVSAFLFPASVPGIVLKSAEQGDFLLCLSPILIEETRRSLLNPRLRRSYGQSEEDVTAWCGRLGSELATIVRDLPEIAPTCRDPNDDHVLAAAVAGGACWIVTGDKDLLTLAEFGEIKIVAAREFLETLARR